MDFILYALIGFASGIISGMGIGGGAIMIPALSIFGGINQHAAQNINLFYFVPTAIIAVNLEADLLRKLFGGFLLIMGINEMRKSFFSVDEKEDNPNDEKMKDNKECV